MNSWLYVVYICIQFNHLSLALSHPLIHTHSNTLLWYFHTPTLTRSYGTLTHSLHSHSLWTLEIINTKGAKSLTNESQSSKHLALSTWAARKKSTLSFIQYCNSISFGLTKPLIWQKESIFWSILEKCNQHKMKIYKFSNIFRISYS